MLRYSEASGPSGLGARSFGVPQDDNCPTAFLSTCGSAISHSMTLLCVPIFVQSVPQAQRDIALSAEGGADLVELRLDDISDEQDVRRIVQGALLPCILTCRPTWEGGRSLLDN